MTTVVGLAFSIAHATVVTPCCQSAIAMDQPLREATILRTEGIVTAKMPFAATDILPRDQLAMPTQNRVRRNDWIPFPEHTSSKSLVRWRPAAVQEIHGW